MKMYEGHQPRERAVSYIRGGKLGWKHWIKCRQKRNFSKALATTTLQLFPPPGKSDQNQPTKAQVPITTTAEPCGSARLSVFVIVIFWPHLTPCGILGPGPGIKPVPPAMEEA